MKLDPVKVERLNYLLQRNIEEIGITEIKPDEVEIRKFCEVIEDTDFEGKIVHPGYIMSLTNPIVQQILTKGGPELFSGLVKAFIHVGSEVEYFKPMIMQKKYKIKVALSEPIEKTGKKGSFCCISFIFSVYDEDNELYTRDNHICFYKL